MRCVSCGGRQDKVVDSRTDKDGRAVRRRRECLTCEHRWTTYEAFLGADKEQAELRVLIAGAYDELGQLLKRLKLA